MKEKFGVGSALLVMLDSLAPAERVVFVLHDIFAVPFDEVATIVDRSPDASRQLANRARRRLRGAPATAGLDRARQREVIDAFLAARVSRQAFGEWRARQVCRWTSKVTLPRPSPACGGDRRDQSANQGCC